MILFFECRAKMYSVVRSVLIYSFLKVKVLIAQLYLTLQPHRMWPARLLCPWNSPGKNTEMGSHSFLQGIFLTQGSHLGAFIRNAPQAPTADPAIQGVSPRSKPVTSIFL